MVLAIHNIFTAYGFWLPNDPRGSWSDYVRDWELFPFGPATKVETRGSIAHVPHNRDHRLAAKAALRYPPVHFSGEQALAVANGFKQAVDRSGFVIHACSILPEHVHMVVKRHRLDDRQVMNQFKGEASKSLEGAGLHPFREWRLPSGRRHTAWTQKGWAVFLNSIEDIHRAVQYVERNPIKEGRPPQRWSFIKSYQMY